MLKSGILEPFWDFGGPKIDPWGDLFGQIGSKKQLVQTTARALEPTWARLGAENGPKLSKNRFLMDFGRILDPFGSILVDFDRFGVDFP